jgi:hypothetical protein
MSDISEGNICLLEQEEIKKIVDKIKEEMILCMNNEYWEKLSDIIYFTNTDRKVTSEWESFVSFISDNSKETFDSDGFDNIISELEKKHEHELIIDEEYCSCININIILYKNKFIQKIVYPIRNLLNEWNNWVKTKYKKSDVNLNEWEILFNELKTKFSLFISSLWEKLLDGIVLENLKIKCKNITIDILKLCYKFDI